MNKISLLFLFAAAWGFAPDIQAQHYYYSPNSIQIPDLSSKHDANLRFGYALGNIDGVELQGAYSPAAHLGVMVNYFVTKNRKRQPNADIGTGLQFLEGALCAYQVVRRTTGSLTAGFGQGRFFNHYGNDLHSDLKVNRWFVQPGIHYADRSLLGGFSLRFSRLSYPRGDSDFAINEAELAALQTIEASSPFFIPEIGLYGALRMEPMSIGINISSIFPNTTGLNFSRFNLGFFVSVDIGDVRAISWKKGK